MAYLFVQNGWVEVPLRPRNCPCKSWFFKMFKIFYSKINGFGEKNVSKSKRYYFKILWQCLTLFEYNINKCDVSDWLCVDSQSLKRCFKISGINPSPRCHKLSQTDSEERMQKGAPRHYFEVPKICILEKICILGSRDPRFGFLVRIDGCYRMHEGFFDFFSSSFSD